MSKWIEPKTVAEAEELKRLGTPSVRLNVCYKCGLGGNEKTTLYRVGYGPDRQTIYGCENHRGLNGQVNG